MVARHVLANAKTTTEPHHFQMTVRACHSAPNTIEFLKQTTKTIFTKTLINSVNKVSGDRHHEQTQERPMDK